MGKFLKYNSGWLIIVILASLPVIRWVFLLPLNLRFIDFNIATTSLGQIVGLLGMTLFSLNLILSSRLKILDKGYLGLSNVYKYHSRIGALSFSLLLFHPLFLLVTYIRISLRSAALFLLPSGNLAVTYGIIALVLMIVLMVLTFYIKLKYHHWKISHKFMVVVFVFAILHILLITSDISRDNFLRFYILTLALLGIAAGFYRAFLSKYWNDNLVYNIIKVNWLSDQVVEIELAPRNKKLYFIAGQFAFFRFFSDNLSSESHPFSMSSAPEEENLKIMIKSLGDYTAKLKSLKVGDYADVDGPFGRFSYKHIDNKNQIWIAGGIGITPFLSMVRDLKDSAYKIDLYYCTSNIQEAVLLDELMGLNLINSNLRIISWCSGDQGRITSQKISELSHSLDDKDIMLCGPDAFMTSLRQQFLSLHVSSRRIHWEQFKFL